MRYHFDQHIIDALLQIKWWEWLDDKIKRNVELLYDPRKLIEAYEKGQCK